MTLLSYICNACDVLVRNVLHDGNVRAGVSDTDACDIQGALDAHGRDVCDTMMTWVIAMSSMSQII
jgi:hypothetical protein